jgi:two-component system, NtrC family, sensor kinase
MNIQVLIAICAALVYLLIAVFIYFQKQLVQVNRLFALMLLCVSIWQIDVAGIRGAPNAEFADLWGNIFRNGLLFIPPTFLHFTIVFTNPQGLSKLAKRILLASYLASCFFAVINWTPYFTGDVIRYPWGYNIQQGSLFPLFVAEFLCCVFMAFFYLVRGYLDADSYHRQRIKYFFLAIVVSFILGSLNFLPMFGIAIYPLGSLTVTVGLMIGAYSLTQHRLMDVSVFMAKTLGYILSLTVLAIPAAIFISWMQLYYFNQLDFSFLSMILLIGGLAALLFPTVKDRMDRALQQIMTKEKYTYHQVLKEFSRRLVTIVDLNRLLNMLAETVEQNMQVSRISVFLFSPEKEIFFPALQKGENERKLDGTFFRPTDSCIRWLLINKDAILWNELERISRDPQEEELFQFMQLLDVEVCLPLVYMDRLIGFINLGAKKDGDIYYREDLDLLNSLANQIAIAIENANLYENLKKTQGIMRRADRLASLGTLIASLAHEIRNPLVSIKTFTQLLPERIEDEEFRNYFLKVASGEIDRLTSLINELLGFARPSEPKLQGEDVNSIIDKIGVLISTEARKKNITIEKKYLPDIPLAMVDAEQVKQVLLNVLLNAIQAIPQEGGNIWVETRLVQIPRDGSSEKFVQIEVRDSGIGIPKENIERVFDPFFSTRPEGSGLGMAISHQIVHEHGGFIDLESEVGKGTTFRIHFPLNRGGRNASA